MASLPGSGFPAPPRVPARPPGRAPRASVSPTPAAVYRLRRTGRSRYAGPVEVRRTLGGAAAGALAAGVWAAQQPLDKRVFGSDYDDVELLGKVVTRAPAWPVVGLFLHIQNGAVFGAAYAWLRPVLPGPPALRGALAGLAEHAGFWPLTRLLDRVHPARDELTPLAGNWRAFTQARLAPPPVRRAARGDRGTREPPARAGRARDPHLLRRTRRYRVRRGRRVKSPGRGYRATQNCPPSSIGRALHL